MTVKKSYRVVPLTPNKDEHYEAFNEVTTIFLNTFPRSSTPEQMYYSPRDHIPTTLACLSGNRVVGGLKKGICRDTGLMTVELMAVHSEERKSGAGTKLLQYLEAQAKKEGRKGITLTPREDAIGFYERHGYEIVDNREMIINMAKNFANN